jgi:hypothetical protein
MKPLFILATALACRAVASRETMITLGSRLPVAVGDTATVCAGIYNTLTKRVDLLPYAKRLRRTDIGTTVQNDGVVPVRDACRPLFIPYGIRTDTLRIRHGTTWELTAPRYREKV